MAQFDVHRNAGASRDTIPFVVVVQSALYNGYHRRVVVPLVKTSALGKLANARFNPVFRIKNIPVALHPLEMVSVATDKLGPVISSLKEEGDQIIAALDELLTRVAG